MKVAGKGEIEFDLPVPDDLNSDAVRVATWVGDRKNANVEKDGPGDKGPLRQERSKKGYIVAHIQVPVPAGSLARRVELKLTKSDGTIVKEKFVFRRGRDKNRDGTKDR